MGRFGSLAQLTNPNTPRLLLNAVKCIGKFSTTSNIPFQRIWWHWQKGSGPVLCSFMVFSSSVHTYHFFVPLWHIVILAKSINVPDWKFLLFWWWSQWWSCQCLYDCLMSLLLDPANVNFFLRSVNEGSANGIRWHADPPSSHKTDVKQFQEVMKVMKSFQGL